MFLSIYLWVCSKINVHSSFSSAHEVELNAHTELNQQLLGEQNKIQCAQNNVLLNTLLCVCLNIRWTFNSTDFEIQHTFANALLGKFPSFLTLNYTIKAEHYWRQISVASLSVTHSCIGGSSWMIFSGSFQTFSLSFRAPHRLWLPRCLFVIAVQFSSVAGRHITQTPENH